MFYIIVVVTIVRSESFDKECPKLPQRHFRAQKVCNESSTNYVCLFDTNKKIYVEWCTDTPEGNPPGQYFVYSGQLRNKFCQGHTYQPFVLRSNNSEKCLFVKSNCTEEGQLNYDNDSATTDRACSCDFNKGFVFVYEPKNKCFCIPSVEDCSCRIDDQDFSEPGNVSEASEQLNCLRNIERSKQSIEELETKITTVTSDDRPAKRDTLILKVIIPMVFLAILIAIVCFVVIWNIQVFTQVKSETKEIEFGSCDKLQVHPPENMTAKDIKWSFNNSPLTFHTKDDKDSLIEIPLTNVTEKMEGLYTCVYTTYRGYFRHDIKVIITPVKKGIVAGCTKILRVSAPKDVKNYTWFHGDNDVTQKLDQIELPSSSKVPTTNKDQIELQIINATDKDKGLYTCEYTTEDGVHKCVFEVIMASVQEVIKVGCTKTLCYAVPKIVTKYTWFHNDKVISSTVPTTNKHQIELQITNANDKDKGLYTCEYTTNDGVDKHVVLVEIVTVYEVTEVGCTTNLVFSAPKEVKKYKWFHGDIVISEKPKTKTHQIEQLITHADFKHKGLYTCEYSTEDGDNKHVVWVEIVTVKEVIQIGTTKILRCIAPQKVKNFKWFHGFEPVNSSGDPTQEPKKNEIELTIEDASDKDKGLYTCEYTTEDGEDYKHVVWVETEKVKCDTKETPFGSSCTLKFHVPERTIVKNFRWVYKEKIVGSRYAADGEHLTNQIAYQIENVTSEIEGLYKCFYTTDDGVFQHDFLVQVTPVYKVVEVGHNETLCCIPKYEVKNFVWFHNDEHIELDEEVHNDELMELDVEAHIDKAIDEEVCRKQIAKIELHIKNAAVGDQGSYTCRYTTDDGDFTCCFIVEIRTAREFQALYILQKNMMIVPSSSTQKMGISFVTQDFPLTERNILYLDGIRKHNSLDCFIVATVHQTSEESPDVHQSSEESPERLLTVYCQKPVLLQIIRNGLHPNPDHGHRVIEKENLIRLPCLYHTDLLQLFERFLVQYEKSVQNSGVSSGDVCLITD